MGQVQTQYLNWKGVKDTSVPDPINLVTHSVTTGLSLGAIRSLCNTSHPSTAQIWVCNKDSLLIIGPQTLLAAVYIFALYAINCMLILNNNNNFIN
jgi:hypothetical protein